MSQVLLSSNYKGYYATLSDLVAALPIGAENWWAQVEENNSVYIWNVDTQEWATGEGNQNNKGYFVDQAALEAAYPVGEAGWYAIVGSTDTIWIWDTETEAWINSGTMGSVSSVFGRTGAVVAESGDYDASEVSSAPFSAITATNVQGALEEIYNEIPDTTIVKEEAQGIKNGLNTIFTLSETPIENSLSLYLNGQLLLEGVGDGYTIDGLTITLTTAPSSGESVFAIYLKLN